MTPPDPQEREAPPKPTLRVACITLDGSTLTVPAHSLGLYVDAIDDGDNSTEYRITFKTMPLREFEALGDFNGF